ncbi:MAG: pyridoxamine 5'-phosphate oxidase family protein [Actinobacteria bacterium]|nr:pyridoxamine 5'-phosphate oxidase family protein [Actinomycetota bacterium]
MTDDEVEAFIEAKMSLQVGTIERDGSIHLSTLWYGIIDGRIVFETYTRSQKIVNLQRDDRITVLLEDGESYETLRGVMIKGRAILYSGDDDVVPVAEAVIRRNQPEVPEEHVAAAAVQMAAKRTAVVVVPEKVVSWDHTKLGGTY